MSAGEGGVGAYAEAEAGRGSLTNFQSWSVVVI